MICASGRGRSKAVSTTCARLPTAELEAGEGGGGEEEEEEKKKKKETEKTRIRSRWKQKIKVSIQQRRSEGKKEDFCFFCSFFLSSLFRPCVMLISSFFFLLSYSVFLSFFLVVLF